MTIRWGGYGKLFYDTDAVVVWWKVFLFLYLDDIFWYDIHDMMSVHSIDILLLMWYERNYSPLFAIPDGGETLMQWYCYDYPCRKAYLLFFLMIWNCKLLWSDLMVEKLLPFITRLLDTYMEIYVKERIIDGEACCLWLDVWHLLCDAFIPGEVYALEREEEIVGSMLCDWALCDDTIAATCLEGLERTVVLMERTVGVRVPFMIPAPSWVQCLLVRWEDRGRKEAAITTTTCLLTCSIIRRKSIPLREDYGWRGHHYLTYRYGIGWNPSHYRRPDQPAAILCRDCRPVAYHCRQYCCSDLYRWLVADTGSGTVCGCAKADRSDTVWKCFADDDYSEVWLGKRYYYIYPSVFRGEWCIVDMLLLMIYWYAWRGHCHFYMMEEYFWWYMRYRGRLLLFGILLVNIPCSSVFCNWKCSITYLENYVTIYVVCCLVLEERNCLKYSGNSLCCLWYIHYLWTEILMVQTDIYNYEYWCWKLVCADTFRWLLMRWWETFGSLPDVFCYILMWTWEITIWWSIC